MKKKLAHHLVSSWKTTLIGAIILAASLVSVFVTAGITWWDASIGMGIGLALLFCPDDMLKRLSQLFTKSNGNDNGSGSRPV